MKIVSTAGMIVIVMVAGAISNVARPILSALARISTVPVVRGVTTPDSSTVATAGLDEVQANCEMLIGFPLFPIAVAVNVTRSKLLGTAGMKIVSEPGSTRTELMRYPGVLLRFGPVALSQDAASETTTRPRTRSARIEASVIPASPARNRKKRRGGAAAPDGNK